MAARGNMSSTARALGVRRSYIASRVESDPELLSIQQEAFQEVIDKAEENIFASVEAGDLNKSEFILRTLGKDRGYTARAETSGPGGGPIPMVGDININFVESPPELENE